jgi:hypothetical protein
MSKGRWKDDPVGLVFACGCKEQIKRDPKNPKKRIKKCPQHAPPQPESDPYPGVPDSAQYWWR